MTIAQNIRKLFEDNHTEMGFAPISAIIDAGFEWEIAHFINSVNSPNQMLNSEDAYAFWDSEERDIQIHVDTFARMLGNEVTDADNAYVVFADGSALAASGWGQTFWHPVEKYVRNDDYAFDGEA